MVVMNRRGMFFTILAIVIVSLFLVSYGIVSSLKERESEQDRVETMNSFVLSSERDLSRQMYIAGYRAIFLFEKKIVEGGEYIFDVDSSFSEIFFNGSLYGEPAEVMTGATFNDILYSLKERGEKINADVDVYNPNIIISQDDPWSIKVILDGNFVFRDRNGLVSWNRTNSVETYIPISSFDDPVYLLNTNGLVASKIVRTPYSGFSSGGNLSEHVDGMYYIESVDAPSFLDRLEGKLSASANGVESLVNLQKLNAQGIGIKSKSVVDYIYFSSSDPGSCAVSGMPSWFRLDSGHLGRYGASCA